MKKRVNVVVEVLVEVDESKFTDEFMKEFRDSFYDFNSIDDHILHLAQLYARGIADSRNGFIEGYGESTDFGIKFKTLDGWEEYAS
jgi:hypothetical protein